MGVYIKGVEMPTTCWFKRFDDCSLTRKKCKKYSGKENDCPIVELPTPHGRLIDADKLVNKAYYEEQAMPEDKQFGVNVDWLVGKTPSVIEAEK